MTETFIAVGHGNYAWGKHLGDQAKAIKSMRREDRSIRNYAVYSCPDPETYVSPSGGFCYANADKYKPVKIAEYKNNRLVWMAFHEGQTQPDNI